MKKCNKIILRLLKKINENNLYDKLICLFIAILSFGAYGGGFRVIRVVIVLFLPFTIITALKIHKTNFNKHRFAFWLFICWFIYAIISVLWVKDVSAAIKEIIYLFIKFIGVFTIIIYALMANNPHLSIIKGWTLLFLITFPIAFYEIFFNKHLSVNSYEELYAYGGVIRRYASVTFGNLNTYNLILVYMLPFLLSTVFKELGKSKIIQILLLALVILINSSRGAFACLLIMLVIILMMSLRKSVKVNRNFLVTLFLAPVIIVVKYYDLIIAQILNRIIEESEYNEDDYRAKVLEYSGDILFDYNLLGVGAGNFQTILEEYIVNFDFYSSHNMFLEVLVQYGVFIFFFYILFLFKIYKRIKLVTKNYQKFIIRGFIFTLPISSIINSNYITNAFFWFYIVSVYLMSFNFNKRKSKNLIKST